jgi:glycine cleavage system aminomethyltransferase T
LLFHGESVLRDGEVVGRVTSGAYGHHLGRATALVMLENEAVLDTAAIEAGGFSVDVAGEFIPATLSVRPFYDPENRRLRS